MKEITVETDMDIDIEDCRVVFFTDTHFGEMYDEKHIERIVEMIGSDDHLLGQTEEDLYHIQRDHLVLSIPYLVDCIDCMDRKNRVGS